MRALRHFGVIIILLITGGVKFAFAQGEGGVIDTGGGAEGGIIDTSGTISGSGTQQISGSSGSGSGLLQNWLSIDTIGELVQKILELVVLVGVPLVALAIIWAGFLFVAAQGNQDKLTKARATLLWTLVGAALVLGANVIAKAIGGTVAELVQ